MLLEDFMDLDILEQNMFHRTNAMSIAEISDSEIIQYAERLLRFKTDNVEDAIILSLRELLKGRVNLARESSIQRLYDQSIAKGIDIPHDIIDDIREKAPDVL